VPANLDSVKCNYQSPHGNIVSNWKKESKKIVYELEIPSGTQAAVTIQKEDSQKIQLEKVSEPGFDTQKVKGLKNGKFDLDEGRYIILVQ
jgi:alpha-L-rhamnosidase